MKEEYVSYEIAHKLKVCGFDWECDHYYESQKEFRESRVFPATFKISDFWHNFNRDDQQNRHNQPFYPECSAPSLSMAQKWLREVKGVYVEPTFIYKYKFELIIKSQRNGMFKVLQKEFGSYELALSEGIDTALKILEEQQ